MGYLNNTVVTVDAILTTKGRQLLAQNDGSFRITQFALADDEIDYTLYNPTQPSGSAYYGEALINMPLLEAFPNETQTMKYKLITLPRGTAKLPILAVPTIVSLKQGQSQILQPETLNYTGGNTIEASGYTFTISDVRLTSTFEGVGINTSQAQLLNVNPQTTGTTVSKTVIGTSLNIRGTTINAIFPSTALAGTVLQATLQIQGRDSGARATISFTLTKV